MHIFPTFGKAHAHALHHHACPQITFVACVSIFKNHSPAPQICVHAHCLGCQSLATRVAFQNPSQNPRHQGWLAIRPTHTPCEVQALQKRLSILEQRTLPSLEQALETHRSSVHSQASLHCTQASISQPCLAFPWNVEFSIVVDCLPDLPVVAGMLHLLADYQSHDAMGFGDSKYKQLVVASPCLFKESLPFESQAVLSDQSGHPACWLPCSHTFCSGACHLELLAVSQSSLYSYQRCMARQRPKHRK